MFIRSAFYFSLVLAGAFSALAQESGTSVVALPEDAAGKPYEIEFEIEYRAQEDRRSERPQTKTRHSLHEIALGGHYRIEKTIGVRGEMAVESDGREQRFFVKEALILYSPWENYVEARIGQQFLPVGLVNERDDWFSSNPGFMEKIFTAEKSIDLGVVTVFRPYNQEWIFLEGGVFSGRVLREEDERSGSPEKTPRVLSLKSKSEFHDAFLTYFEHDYAYFDPVRAFGGGFELRSPRHWPVRGEFMIEHWRFQEIQSAGPDVDNQAWLLHGRVEWWRLGLGHRFSQNNSHLRTVNSRFALPTEVSRLSYVDFKIAEPFLIRGEAIKEVQDEVVRDELVARALLSWEI